MSQANTAELDAPAKSQELTVVERASIALKSSTHETELRALVENTASLVVVKNTAGRDQVHAAGMRFKNARVAIQKAGKEAREDATRFSKAVIEEEKRLIAISEPEENRLFALRDEWDEAREAEKRELARLEEERQAQVQARIDAIKNVIVQVAGKTSAEIDEAAVSLDFLDISIEDFGKRADEAEQIKVDTIARLGEMTELAKHREDAAAAAALRAEEERQAQARIAAEQKAERERLAARQRELDEQEAQARAKRAEEDRIAQERRDQADHEARVLRAAEDRRIAERAADLRRQEEEIDRARRAAQAKADEEAERIRAAEQKRLDDEAAEARRVQQEADDARRAAEERKHSDLQEIRARAMPMYEALLKVVEQHDIYSKRGALAEFEGEEVISASILVDLYDHAMDAIQDLPVIADYPA